MVSNEKLNIKLTKTFQKNIKIANKNQRDTNDP